MKILHLALISGIIIATVSIGYFTFLNQSLEDPKVISTQSIKENQTDTKNSAIDNALSIEWLNNTYLAGYPVDIDVKFENQIPNCQMASVLVKNLSSGVIVFGPTILQNYTGQYCTTDRQIKFYAGLENNTLIPKTQRYSVQATLYGKTGEKEFTVIPSTYSGKNITAVGDILPGTTPFLSCPAIQGTTSAETIQSSTGFSVYHRYLNSDNPTEVDDYLLEPGQSGSITLKIQSGSSFPLSENFATGMSILNSKSNYGNFEHPGLTISYFPPVALAGLDGIATVSINISVSSNATLGTYWAYLPPGGCVGGKIILLTIGSEPLAQPPDLLGYESPVIFSFGESPILTVDLFNNGIHTFDNCTLEEISDNETSVIERFNYIPPGLESKYHFSSNPPSGNRVVFECENPYVLNTYTSK